MLSNIIQISKETVIFTRTLYEYKGTSFLSFSPALYFHQFKSLRKLGVRKRGHKVGEEKGKKIQVHLMHVKKELKILMS